MGVSSARLKLDGERLAETRNDMHMHGALAGPGACGELAGLRHAVLAADDAHVAAGAHGAWQVERELGGSVGRARAGCRHIVVEVVGVANLEKVANSYGLGEVGDGLLALCLDDAARILTAVVAALVAHEIVVMLAVQVTVGEVAVEGACQVAHDRGVHTRVFTLLPLVERGAVRLRDGAHVVGGLHPALEFHARAPRFDERVDVGNRAVVARRHEARAVHAVALHALFVDEAVGQAAGLAAQAAVGRLSTLHAAEQAQPRVAHADGAVSEHLKLDPLMRARFDFGKRHLARQRHARAAGLFGKANACGIVDVALGGEVDLDLRPQGACQRDEAPVGHDEGVGAGEVAVVHEGERPGHLFLGDEDVHRDVDARACQMGQLTALAELVEVQVVGVASRIEAAKAAVDGVGPCSERRLERFPCSGRAQELGGLVRALHLRCVHVLVLSWLSARSW